MSDDLAINPKIRVLLRNRTRAVVTHVVSGLAPWSLLGHMEIDRAAVQLWRRDGRWRDDGARHDLDIVGYRNHAGQLVAFTGLQLTKKP